MNKKVTKADLLDVLNQMNEEELQNAPEIEYSKAFEEQMEEVYREAYAKNEKKKFKWRPIAAAAAVILFVFFFTYIEAVAQFMEQFSLTQVGENLVIERVTPLPEKEFDFLNVTYEVPKEYKLKIVDTTLSYNAIWEREDGNYISISVTDRGPIYLDNEYAQEIQQDTINGIDVTIYKKFDAWVIFGQDEQFMYDVIGFTDLETVKSVFESIDVEGQ